MKRLLQSTALLALVLFSQKLSAQDRYFSVPLDKLGFTQGTLPALPKMDAYASNGNFQLARALRPKAWLDGAGEAYFVDGPGHDIYPSPLLQNLEEARILVHAPAGAGDVTGRLWLPKPDLSGMTLLKFKIPAAETLADAKSPFLKAKMWYYKDLLDSESAGAAYFRYQLDQALKENIENPTADMAIGLPVSIMRPDHLEDTYGLLSGGRAVAENLQLERTLRRPKNADDTPTVSLDSIKGITLQAFDWTALIKDLHPATDPLAALVPEDQHILLFPSFQAFSDLLSQTDQQSLPLLQLAEPRSEDALTQERYERQLGLSVSVLGKLLGPTLINSVAVTGSDPYYRMGTDMAILFEAKGADPTLLRQALLSQIALKMDANIKPTPFNGEGFTATSFTTPDRLASSYVAAFGNVVVVTNSPIQLAAIADVLAKKRKPLSGTPEYTFFRNRYPRDNKDESALLVLTDATIRRWCGPRVRIADVRRTAALAALADMTAARMAHPAATDAPPASDYPGVTLGDVTANPSGVRSSLYNTNAFMTPIAELALDKVSPKEQQAYEQWRDGYQLGFRQYFDPIAVRFSLTPKQARVDLTVMPLIEGTVYSRGEFSIPLLSLTKGARLKTNAGDPHNALAHLVLAINPKSELFATAGNFATQMTKAADPLSWLGSSIALYADDDPFWQEIAKAPDTEKFVEEKFPGLPVALRVESANPLKLAAFLTALRAYADQSAPNMVTWETRTHAGLSYVCITPIRQALGENPGPLAQLSLYYAPTPDALTVTLSEPLMKRALERYAAATQPASSPLAAQSPASAWLGNNLALHLDGTLVSLFYRSERKDLETEEMTRAWSNLPILNEIKRLYPDADAPTLYTKFWSGRLMDPTGGTYVWNAEFQTYESTAFGHPGSPKTPAGEPAFLRDFSAFDFGLTFEKNGLAGSVLLQRRQ